MEDIPRNGLELAEELREIGAKVKASAEKELAEFYPQDEGGGRPIAYLWCRTVRCESPNCGAEIPLVRSFWLSKKASNRWALQSSIVRPKNDVPRIEFEVIQPRTEKEIKGGTVSRAKATCLCCNTVLGPDRVRSQLAIQRGGANAIFNEKGKRTGGARILAVVTLTEGQKGRNYRLPGRLDYEAVWKAQQRLEEFQSKKESNGLSSIPNEPTPSGGGSGAGRAFSIQKYGMMQWCDLFTARQMVGLLTILSTVKRTDSSESCRLLTALAVGRLADQMSSLVRWLQTIEAVASTFGRQALPIVWDFCEIIPTGSSSANFGAAVEWVIEAVESEASIIRTPGQLQQADATKHPLSNESVSVLFTDPPYYDAIPYSDLSDYFFVWLKRALPGHPLLRDPFDLNNPLTPKTQEAVQDESRFVAGKPKDKEFFEDAMSKAFSEGRRILRDDGIGCVVFAHKTTEGWEALLSGLINGGWTITGSWPIVTERAVRVRARDSAALATSVHLICRPRPEDAETGDWGGVLRELPDRVHDWMDRLEREGVRGADLVFACIGPALEIFSRYSRVETAEGKEIKLDVYLQKVWEVVGRIALEKVLGTAEAKARNGAAGALEEDARLTALFLWTIQATGTDSNEDADSEDELVEDDDEDNPAGSGKGFSLVFDVARRFAQPLGIHLDDWEGRVIETKNGLVRLLPVAERAKQLFGEEGAQAVADRIEQNPGRSDIFQPTLFGDEPPVVKGRKGRKGKGANVSEESLKARREATTLDRVHAAMLLQASGRTNALRALLKAEKERGPEFVRLANALSALYPPQGCEEKRLLDAMLLAVPS